MTLLALIRHGETAWNKKRRMQGHADIPLTDEGRQKLATLCVPDTLKIARWYTSPLSRARETAQCLGIDGALADRRLIETDWGHWQGKTIAQLREELGNDFLENEAKGLDFRPPGGESPRDVIHRLAPFLAEVADSRLPSGAVTHKGVIRAVLSMAYDWDMTVKAPVALTWQCVHLFEVRPGGKIHPVQMNMPLAERQKALP